MSEHPNALRVRALFRAFHERDLAAIRDALAEDAVWRFPGCNLLSGEHRGHGAILTFLAQVAQLTEGTFSLELEDVVANDRRAVALFRGHGRRAGRALDNPTCLVIELADGRATRISEFVWDLPSVDRFWS